MLPLLLSALAFALPDAQAPDAPAAAASAHLPVAQPDAEGLDVAFGEGVRLTAPENPFQLTLRGRVQLRATARHSPDDEDPLDILLQVRRARLVLRGQLPSQHLELYLQVGLGPSDLEADRPVPLRDWVLTWSRVPALSLRLGQMKVPFSRERMVSSSALQFVDRSVVNAELNLDRDIGAQLFSNDLLGGHLAYQLGVYGGEGRNRVNDGAGLLYVARLTVQPLGDFPDQLTEADLTRSKRARLSIGASVATNREASREASTHGALLTSDFHTQHAAADLMFKWRGLSAQAELIARTSTPTGPGPVDANGPTEGYGATAQLGYVTAQGIEVAGRHATTAGLPDSPRPTPTQRVSTACLGYYLQGHDLKLQLDGSLLLSGESLRQAWQAPGWESRLQLQVYF